MNIQSEELWDSLEAKLNKVIDNKDLDHVLIQKCELLINRYTGNVNNDNAEVVIPDVKTLVLTLSQENYYKSRRVEKADRELLTDLATDLSLFEKVLSQEYRIKLKENANKTDKEKAERYPNIDNDKSMNLYKQV